MLTIVFALLLAAPTEVEIDQVDRSMDAYQTCLVTNARLRHASDPKLSPERAVAAASPACEPQAAKLAAVAKVQYSQRDSNGNVARSLPGDAMLDDLNKAAVMRYRASSHIWDSRSQLWHRAKNKQNSRSDSEEGTNNKDNGRN
jgi:hypothetical protein